jgi:hypothetical protein
MCLSIARRNRKNGLAETVMAAHFIRCAEAVGTVRTAREPEAKTGSKLGAAPFASYGPKWALHFENDQQSSLDRLLPFSPRLV